VRFLVDECTGPAVAHWLRGQSHDVFSVYDEAPGMSDDEVLSKAAAENRILITTDKDFGEFIFRRKRAHRGTILLRLDDERGASKIAAIGKLLRLNAVLADRFVVVTKSRVRFAR
jgi:predicted nuclease of predicted toxin-antitoxin system